MTGLADLGVRALVCLLTDAELIDLNLEDEDGAAQRAGLMFLRLPIADRGLPERATFRPLVATLVAARRRSEHVVVHCRFGIGRSSVVAAAVLVAEGVDPEQAWQRVGDARGRTVPDTAEQRVFVGAEASWSTA